MQESFIDYMISGAGRGPDFAFPRTPRAPMIYDRLHIFLKGTALRPGRRYSAALFYWKLAALLYQLLVRVLKSAADIDYLFPISIFRASAVLKSRNLPSRRKTPHGKFYHLSTFFEAKVQQNMRNLKLAI